MPRRGRKERQTPVRQVDERLFGICNIAARRHGRRGLDFDLSSVRTGAAAVRDRAFGARVTFSPKVFIPLTMLCRDRCGYCTFAKAPARIDSPYLTPDDVLAIARRGAAMGCHEALFTLGEAPEDRYTQAAEWLAARGYADTVEYLVAMARLVVEETGLLPHANAGALDEGQLARLRRWSPSQGVRLPDGSAVDGIPSFLRFAGVL